MEGVKINLYKLSRSGEWKRLAVDKGVEKEVLKCVQESRPNYTLG